MPLVVVNEAVDGGWLGGVESAFCLGAQGRLVGLDRQQVIGSLVLDRLRDFGVGGDGVDRDERAFQAAVLAEPLKQDRNRRKLVGPLVVCGCGLFAEIPRQSHTGSNTSAAIAAQASIFPCLFFEMV